MSCHLVNRSCLAAPQVVAGLSVGKEELGKTELKWNFVPNRPDIKNYEVRTFKLFFNVENFYKTTSNSIEVPTDTDSMYSFRVRAVDNGDQIGAWTQDLQISTGLSLVHKNISWHKNLKFHSLFEAHISARCQLPADSVAGSG